MPKYFDADSIARISQAICDEFGEQCYFAIVYTTGDGIAAALRSFMGQPAGGQLNFAANVESAIAVELIKGGAEAAPILFKEQIEAFRDRIKRAADEPEPVEPPGPPACPTCQGTGKIFNGLLGEDRPCIDCQSEGNA